MQIFKKENRKCKNEDENVRMGRKGTDGEKRNRRGGKIKDEEVGY